MAKQRKKPKIHSVGYRRPPKKSQFKKGESGNPKGRPKGTRNLKTELEEELQEQIVVREGGKQKKVSKRRAMIKGQVAKAMKGDPRSFSEVVKLERSYPGHGSSKKTGNEESDNDQEYPKTLRDLVLRASKWEEAEEKKAREKEAKNTSEELDAKSEPREDDDQSSSE